MASSSSSLVSSLLASSTTSLQQFAANVTPLRLFQQDTHVYKALLRGIYIIRSRLKSNIMNHASCLGSVYNGVVGRSALRGIPRRLSAR